MAWSSKLRLVGVFTLLLALAAANPIPQEETTPSPTPLEGTNPPPQEETQPRPTTSEGGNPPPQEETGPSPTAVNFPPKPEKYMAFGDSFAAGIGAGSEFGFSHLDSCHRYDGGYPSQIHAEFFGTSISDANLRACTGAKAAEIQAQAEFLDDTVDLVSLRGSHSSAFPSAISLLVSCSVRAYL